MNQSKCSDLRILAVHDYSAVDESVALWWRVRQIENCCSKPVERTKRLNEERSRVSGLVAILTRSWIDVHQLYFDSCVNKERMNYCKVKHVH